MQFDSRQSTIENIWKPSEHSVEISREFLKFELAFKFQNKNKFQNIFNLKIHLILITQIFQIIKASRV